VNSGKVVSVSYELRELLRYEYAAPIEHLRHRLMIAPRTVDNAQQRIRHELRVSPGLSHKWETDAFGNLVVTIEAQQVESEIQLDYRATIRRRDGPSRGPEQFWIDDDRFRSPSQLTKPSEMLRSTAERLLIADDGGGKLASLINEFVFQHMRYVTMATTVETTAAEAFAQGTGVCRDFAHVVIALCRLCGIPARYVVGYVVGEVGTHQWIEVIEPALGTGVALAVGYDPMHERRIALDHISIAAGRDYADVALASAKAVAPHASRYTMTRRVDVFDVEYSA
jgi:transglutaminase-like putative cysteine protease